MHRCLCECARTGFTRGLALAMLTAVFLVTPAQHAWAQG